MIRPCTDADFDAMYAIINDAKDRLLKKYWSIPERQVETSVVLAEEAWFD
ncbi:MAG: hypothetical protein ACLQNE_45440 [Thermoguttaceae bacterium]